MLEMVLASCPVSTFDLSIFAPNATVARSRFLSETLTQTDFVSRLTAAGIKRSCHSTNEFRDVMARLREDFRLSSLAMKS